MVKFRRIDGQKFSPRADHVNYPRSTNNITPVIRVETAKHIPWEKRLINDSDSVRPAAAQLETREKRL